MSRRDLLHRDASSRAASELEYVIHSAKENNKPMVPMVTSKKAMAESRVFNNVSDRDVTRVLFISQNTELLNPTKQTLDGYIDISDLFDEVHILILRQGIKPRNPVIRLSYNTWIYTASSKFWWMTPKAGLDLAEEQLEFASGFRPDLIVARDPFESAIAAIKLQEKHNCPIQLHIMEDYTTRKFLQKNKYNFWRLALLRYAIPKFKSVRTFTSSLLTTIQKKYTIADADVLPSFQNYESLIDSPKSIDLKGKYKAFVFFILFTGKLDYGSTLYRAIDAARFVLKNPRVGLIVIGDGKLQSEFARRAKILGIEDQVIFEKGTTDIVPYLKSANILIISDTDLDSEEVVLKGAAAGIPMIMSRTDKREDLFEHGESAFLCEETDIQAFADRINDLLNKFDIRKKFIKNTQDMIKERFHADPSEYQESYRTSIEQAFFMESDKTEKDSKN